MPTLQAIITERFLAKLRECEDMDEAKIEQLQSLFAAGKKIKPDDLVKILSSPAGSDVK
ncbi:MAG: hypothetical protein ACXWKP_22165 [Bradyrhizobium sp.]